MKTADVKTGFGYFTDKDGHIISKAELPIGEHPYKDKFNYTEVATEQDLNNITIFKPEPTEQKVNENRIKNMVQKLAITECKNQGLIPADYPEPEIT